MPVKASGLMPGIYGAAIIVTVFVLAGAAAVWWAGGRRSNALLPALLALPLSPLVNYFIKRPLLLGFSDLTGISLRLGPGTPWWFLLAIHWLAPLTEEAIKLTPLLVPAVRSQLAPRGSLVRLALALGLGFGLGEAWWIAWGVAASGQYATVPFYQFTGFMNERLLTTFVHGAMTGVALRGFERSVRHGLGAAVAGYAGAVLLHALANVGAALYQVGLIGPLVAYSLLVGTTVLLAWILGRIYREGTGQACGSATSRPATGRGRATAAPGSGGACPHP